jgi:hypothetical protein
MMNLQQAADWLPGARLVGKRLNDVEPRAHRHTHAAPRGFFFCGAKVKKI